MTTTPLPPPPSHRGFVSPPTVERWSRLLKGTLKQECISFLRECGVDERSVSESDISQSIDLLTLLSSERDTRSNTFKQIRTFAKDWMIKQIRLLHNPLETARYLSYTFSETLYYCCSMLFWLIALKLADLYTNHYVFMILRIIMTLHMGYYTAQWLFQVLRLLLYRARKTGSFIARVTTYMPIVMWEFSSVLFEVFIGWPLLTSVVGVLTSLYLIPLVYPYMRLSSLLDDLYDKQVPVYLVWITYLC